MKGVVICGPTGVGKTKISLKVAKALGAEIISADSMQVYKYMDIGTAKISFNEMEGIKHYLIDVVEPTEKFNVNEYKTRVDVVIEEAYKRKINLLITGGTGMYINAVTNGLSDAPEGNDDIRKELGELSNEELYSRLVMVDSESANDIHMNNRKRVIRALEVFYISGNKFSSYKLRNNKNNLYSFKKYGLERNREYLYELVESRIDKMFEDGLLKEAKFLFENFRMGVTSVKAIGYKELFDYFEGRYSLEEAVKLIKQNTRNYVKRQFTWFKNEHDITWFDLDKIDEDEIVNRIIDDSEHKS